MKVSFIRAIAGCFQRYSFLFLVGILGAIAFQPCLPTSADALETVTLKLKWVHQFQFAGFYAAKAQGYYREAGLDVKFLEAGPDKSIIDTVLDGSADYGIEDCSLLLARSAGKPVVVLGAIFQHSPSLLLARQDSPLQSVHDLVGKRIMIAKNADEIMAYLLSEGLTPDRYTAIPPSFNPQDLIDGKVDATTAYVTNEPYFLDQTGINYLAFTPRSAGIDFYGDNLFTTEQEQKKHPERTKAFREASFRGWKYAMTHQEELADLILAEYSQAKTRENLLFEARQMIPLIQPDLVELGYMNPGRWRHIADIYADLGLLPRNYPFDGFFYEDAVKTDHTYILILALVFGVSLLISLGFVFLLRNMVRRKSEDLENVNRSLLKQGQLMASIVNGTTDAVFIKDMAGKYINVNDEVVRLYAKDRAEILGQDDRSFFSADEAKFIMDLDQVVMAGGKVVTTEECVTTLSQPRVYLSTKGPVYDEQGRVTCMFGINRDITEIKQQEEALKLQLQEYVLSQKQLKESEARFKALQEAFFGGIVIHDQGKILDCNQGLSDLTGFSTAELIGADLLQLIAPSSIDQVRQRLKSGYGQGYEVEGLRKDSSLYPLAIRGKTVPYRGSQAQVLEFRDITERKRAEELLWNERAFLRSLIDSAEDLIYFKDQDSIYLGCNKASERFTGLREAEQIGKSDFDFFSSELAEQIVKQDQKVLASGISVRIEEWISTPTSGLRLLETVKAPIYGAEGQPIGLVGISRDITERYQLQEELRESEERFKKMFRNHTAMMLLIDPDSGEIVDANLAAEQFYGYSHNEMLDVNINQINLLPPQDIEAVLSDALQENQNYFVFVHKLSRGDIRTVEVYSTPIHINTQTLLFSIIHDISDRKRAEEEKLILEQQLQHHQKLESLGVLAGGIAHDFNNILAGLYGNISLAKAKLVKDYPDHPGLRYLEAAGNSMNSATLLSGQLLIFAKGGDPVKENLNLYSLIEEIVHFNLSGSNVKPIISLAENLLQARADQGQIQQVFANLTTNAKQAMPDGGHLYIDLKNISLSGDEFADLDGGDYLVITVTDEGMGIAENHLDRIFDPYFTTKQTGSGLGLATVYSIIQKHGGHVGVSSRLGKGTTFTLYLPASEKVPEAAEALVSLSGNPLPTARILVLDDEEMIRNIVSDMLEEFGFEASTVAEGLQALKLYQQALTAEEPFDLVILDLTIPGGIGGKEVARQILEIDPQARLVVSSGYADDPVMANPAAYGFSGVIAKPYNLDTLKKLIPRFLGAS